MFKKVLIGFSVLFILAALFTACKMEGDAEPTYTVIYNSNFGNDEPDQTKTTTFTFGGSNKLGGTLSGSNSTFEHPEGLSLIGWSTTRDGEVTYVAGVSVQDNLTVNDSIILYARWGYIIEFRTNGGSTFLYQGVLPNKRLNEPLNKPPLAGHEFVGWYTENDVLYVFSDEVKNAFILFAKWIDPSALLVNTIEFEMSGPINKTYGDIPFVNAIKMGSQGTGTIVYTSSNPTVATVNFNTGLVTPLKAGSTTITARKEADETYAAAEVQYTINIALASPIAPNPPRLESTNETSGTIVLRPPLDANSAFTLEYARSTADSPPMSNWQVELSFSGLYAKTDYYFFARYKEDQAKNYESPASNSITATTASLLLPCTIEFETAGPINKKYGDSTFANPVNPGSPGAGTISYSSGTPAVAAVNSGTGLITILKAGSTVITATKASDGTYAQATAQYTLEVALATPAAPNPPKFNSCTPNSITLNEPDGANTTLYKLEYAYSENFTAPSNGWKEEKTFSGLTADSSYIFFARYKAVPEKNNVSEASGSLIAQTAGLLSRSISFDSSGPIYKTYGDSPFTNAVRTNSTGGGTISYRSNNTAVATVNANTGEVTILKAGSAIITATKDSDGTYALVTATYSLEIDLANPGAPNPPRLNSNSTNSVTLDEPNGSNTTLFTLEYAYNTSTSAPSSGWQEGKTFSGLLANTGYFFFARYKAISEKNNVSAASGSLSASTSNMLSRTIEFESATMTKTYGDAAFTNAIKSGSLGGGAVSYSINTPDPGVATIVSSSGQVTILKTGSTTITARKEADGTYALATVSYTLQVNAVTPAAPGAPTLSSSTQSTVTLIKPTGTNTDFVLEYAYNTSTSAPSSGWQTELSFSNLTPNTQYYFFARYKANSDKNNVSAASTYLSVKTPSLETNTLSFTSSTVTKSYGDPAFTHTFSSTGSGSGAITYQSGNTSVATVNSTSGLVTIVKPGTATITATKASDGTYAQAQASYTLTVNSKNVTITGLTATSSKVYDRLTSAAVTGTAVISGLVSGDTVTITHGNANYADYNVGTGKTITFSGYSLSGTHAANYNLSAQPTGATNGSITAKGLTITGVTADSKVYDAKQDATSSNGTLSGVISGDTVTFVRGSGTFNTKDVGTGKTVTFSGFTLSGAQAGNYSLTQPANVTNGIITVKQISLTIGTPAILSPVSPSQTFTVYSSGFVASDTPTLTVSLASNSYGVSISGTTGTGVSNTTTKTVTLDYNDTTVTNTAAFNLALTISGNTNYSLTGTNNVSVTVCDGRAAGARAIPVNSTNYTAFNSYANTTGLARNYKQTSSFSISAITNNWTPIGTKSAPFTGTYDGQGYYIWSISCYYTTGGESNDYQGLFGYIKGSSCTIENLYASGTVRGKQYTGLLVGYNEGGTIRKCFSGGQVQANPVNGSSQPYYASYAGGLVGYNTGTIQNCYSKASVLPLYSDGNYHGGLVGYNTGKVLYCYATGSVKGINWTSGVVGYNSSTGEVRYCAAMNSQLTANSPSYGGRVVGLNDGTIGTLYASSDMTLTYTTGSFNAQTSGASTKDGATVYSTDYGNQTFWSSTMAFSFQSSYTTGSWEWISTGTLPKLYGLAGQ